MNGPGHRLLGMAFALGLANVTGLDLIATAGAVTIAGATAHGRTSPDVDQFPIWRGGRIGARRARTVHVGPLHWRRRARKGRKVRGLSALFPAGTRGHRYVTHLWWWPACGAALTAFAWAVCTVLAPVLAPWWWVPGSVANGWTSHLFGDFLFGKARWVQADDGTWTCTQAAGIPMTPHGGHIGLGWFKVGAFTERATTAVLLPAVLVFQVWLATGGHACDVLTLLSR